MADSKRTAKTVREQLLSDDKVLALMMSDLRSLRKLVADAELATLSHSGRPIASLMEPTALDFGPQRLFGRRSLHQPNGCRQG
jgi:hypothetical protein